VGKGHSVGLASTSFPDRERCICPRLRASHTLIYSTYIFFNSGLWMWKAQLTQGLLYQFSENPCAPTVSKEFQVSSATLQRPIWNTSARLGVRDFCVNGVYEWNQGYSPLQVANRCQNLVRIHSPYTPVAHRKLWPVDILLHPRVIGESLESRLRVVDESSPSRWRVVESR